MYPNQGLQISGLKMCEFLEVEDLDSSTTKYYAERAGSKSYILGLIFLYPSTKMIKKALAMQHSLLTPCTHNPKQNRSRLRFHQNESLQ